MKDPTLEREFHWPQYDPEERDSRRCAVCWCIQPFAWVTVGRRYVITCESEYCKARAVILAGQSRNLSPPCNRSPTVTV